MNAWNISGPGRYRKTATVEAMQISMDTAAGEHGLSRNSLSVAAITGWMKGNGFHDIVVIDDNPSAGFGLRIKSLEGWVDAFPGDWICRGVEGEFWRVREDIFAKTYAEAEDD